MKVCKRCNIKKSKSEFHQHKQTKDKLKPNCKECVSILSAIWYQNNKERAKAVGKIWRDTNKKQISKRNKEYYLTNKEKVHNNTKAWRKRNPGSGRETALAWRRANLERARENSRIWAKNNPHKTAANSAKRRAKIRKQTPDLSKLEKQLIDSLYWSAMILSNSCGEQFHVDHIYPISKGGLHCFDNLQILSAEENLKKGDR